MSDCLFYLHIPKTAGMTFKRVLASQFPVDQIHDIPFETYLFQDAIERYKAASPEYRAAIRCVMGHMPFGLHRWAPGGFRYVTFVRDPVERVLSSHEYIRRRQALQQEIGLPPGATLDLERYLDFEAAQGLSNLQVRAISGAGDFIDHVLPPFQPLPGDALPLALENIERHLAVVGVVEKFDESLLLMRREFGWKRTWYVRRNVSPQRLQAAALGETVLARIRRDNSLDLELYGHARDLLEQRIRRLGPRFALELRRFRVANRLYRISRAVYLAGPMQAIGRLRALGRAPTSR